MQVRDVIKALQELDPALETTVGDIRIIHSHPNRYPRVALSPSDAEQFSTIRKATEMRLGMGHLKWPAVPGDY